MQENITYSMPEIQNLKQDVYSKLNSIQRALGILKNNLTVIERVINDKGKDGDEWKVRLPSSLIKSIKGVSIHLPEEQLGKCSIKWKKSILEAIKRNDMPMNSALLYHKIRQQYPEYEGDRRFMIKNISSALNGLYNDDKLFRHLFKGRNDYLYGLSEFYDGLGKIKEEYFSKFKREYDGIL